MAGDKSRENGKKGGRPRLPATPEQAHAAAQRERAQIIDRRRQDCKRLAKAIQDVSSMADYGAGPKSSPATALGTLARATQTLHDLERDVYDLGVSQAKSRAVFLIPQAPKTMDEWERQAKGQIPGIEAKQDARRREDALDLGSLPAHVEELVQGEPPEDWTDPGEGEPDEED